MAVPRTLRLILVATLLVIALIGTALIVILLALDDDDYRDIARLAVEEALGWTLEVNGPLSVRPSLSFAVTGEDAVLNRGETRLATAKRATFTLQLPALPLGQFRFAVDVEEPTEYTDYRCGVFGIRIEDGMVRSDRAIALQSEKFNVGGDGYIDLKKETLGLAIRPKAKKGLGVSVGTLLGGFVVGGTLSSPEVEFDKAGVAVTVTVGVIVNLLRDWASVDDFSCANTLERIEKQRKTRSSEQ